MLHRLKALRTNENVLIAIDTLVQSKGTFLSTFLMTYMIRTSLENEPTDYIVFKIFTYALMAVFALLLMGFLKRFTLLAWRLGMIFAVVQVLIILFVDTQTMWFPYVLAAITGLEAILYHRPNTFFLVTEVRNDRRLRFQSIRQIFIEISKIIMPVTLGLLITDRGFSQAGIVILIISVVQVLLSFLFRPSRELHERKHHLRVVLKKITRTPLLRRVMYLQFFRGALVSGSAFLIIPTLMVYDYTASDLDLGFYASVASAVAIVMILVYRQLKRKKIGSRLFLGIIAPLTILLPLILALWPSAWAAILLYAFTVACFEGFLNMFLSMKIQNWLKKRIGDHAYTLEVEAISEVFLCTGRVASLAMLLYVFMASGTAYLAWFCVICAVLVVPIVLLSTRSLNKSKNMV